MIKIDPIFQVVSIGTIILCSSSIPAIAAKPLAKEKKTTHWSEISLTQLTTPLPPTLKFEQSIPSDLSEISLTQLTTSLPPALKFEPSIPFLISQTTETETTETETTETETTETETTETETTESETTESEASKLERLDPNPDPLAIPTTPLEVTIEIDEPITLEEAIQLALDNNKDLQEARLNLERSERELDQARSALYPDLSLQSNYQNSETAAGNRSQEIFEEQAGQAADSTTGDSITTFTGNLTIEYDIYTGGSRGADIRRAKKQVEFSELSLETATEQIIFETKNNYYSLQNADSQVDIEQATVEDALQTLRDAQLLEQAGLGTRFDVLRAEVELANAQQALTTAEANQINARRQLVETLSLGEQVDLQTADEVARAGTWNLAIEESIISAYENRAELEQFLVNREINQEQRQIALAQIRPQLSIFGQLDFLEQTGDGFDPTAGYTVGATLQWNIWDGGTASAIAKQEDVDVALADNGFADQQNVVRLEVEQAFYSLQANDENIGTSSKAVELAEESLRLARLRFQAGVGTQTDVIEAQTELSTARGNFIAAIINYNQSLNELQRAVTGIPDTQIDTPISPGDEGIEADEVLEDVIE